MSSDGTGSIFELPDADGATESERILTRLCRQSFLSLWSYPNIYRAQGDAHKDGDGKELADLLVIFGNRIAVFSDKHISFQETKPVPVAWARWYKKAIAKSADQLLGAKRWLEYFPDNVYLDKKCTRRLPINIPLGTDVEIHLVAVTRGSFQAADRYFSEVMAL